MECTKTILSAYKNLDRVINEIERCVEDRCLGSYYDNREVSIIFNEIAAMIERKDKLIGLKKKIDYVFSLLSDEEIDLLNCKYFSKRVKNKFDFSLRTYFRKQVRLFNKLDEYFGYIGIIDEYFFKEFKNDRFFRCAKIKADDVKRSTCDYYKNCTEKNLLKKDKKTVGNVATIIDGGKRSFENQIAV